MQRKIWGVFLKPISIGNLISRFGGGTLILSLQIGLGFFWAMNTYAQSDGPPHHQSPCRTAAHLEGGYDTPPKMADGDPRDDIATAAAHESTADQIERVLNEECETPTTCSPAATEKVIQRALSEKKSWPRELWRKVRVYGSIMGVAAAVNISAVFVVGLLSEQMPFAAEVFKFTILQVTVISATAFLSPIADVLSSLVRHRSYQTTHSHYGVVAHNPTLKSFERTFLATQSALPPNAQYARNLIRDYLRMLIPSLEMAVTLLATTHESKHSMAEASRISYSDSADTHTDAHNFEGSNSVLNTDLKPPHKVYRQVAELLFRMHRMYPEIAPEDPLIALAIKRQIAERLPNPQNFFEEVLKELEILDAKTDYRALFAVWFET